MSLILLLLFVTMTAAADDGIHQRNCRRGVELPITRSLRASSVPSQAGGDFYHGDCHQLVVLASFQDQSFSDDEVATYLKWNKIFNAENYQEESYVGSVRDYFHHQSGGRFNLIFDIFQITLPDSLVRYHSTYSHDEYSQYMVDDIVDSLQALDIDWSKYDWNGDGYVNQLLIVYAGKGQNAGGGSNTIWPHQWWLSKHLKNPDNFDEGYRDSRTVTDGDKAYTIDAYCCVQEVVNTGDTFTPFGTIIHEYTHCFGIPDFYNGATQYVGKWELMDYGNYNGGGYCPPNYSAHERWLMGWLDLTELKTDTTITAMKSLSDGCQEAYLIRNNGHSDEYYIVENRQKVGWDRELPGSGLMVFHVDFDAKIWVSIFEMPNTTSRKRYHVFPANNMTSTYSSSGWAYPYNDNNQLTNESSPAATLNNNNLDGTKLMSKPITNMAVTGGLASFNFAVTATGISNVSASTKTNITYALDGRRVENPTKGIYIMNGKKVVIK